MGEIERRFMEEARARLPEGDEGLRSVENYLTQVVLAGQHRYLREAIDHLTEALAKSTIPHFHRFWYKQHPHKASTSYWLWFLHLQKEGVLGSAEQAAQFAGPHH